VFPKLLKYLRHRSLVLKLSARLRGLLRLRVPNPTSDILGDISGGPDFGGRVETRENAMISDPEFHDLVQRAENTNIETLSVDSNYAANLAQGAMKPSTGENIV
jgi:hypothetical protein